MKWLVITFLFVGMSSPVWAYEKGTIGFMIKAYSKNTSNKYLLDSQFKDMQDGASWVNLIGEKLGNKKIYCPPGNLVLQGGQIFSIFRRYVERKNSLSDDVNIRGMLMVFALRDAFPCK